MLPARVVRKKATFSVNSVHLCGLCVPQRCQRDDRRLRMHTTLTLPLAEEGSDHRTQDTCFMKWTDTRDIAIALEETHPDVDNVNLRYTDLHKWVTQLADFDDDPQRSNEKILEAIQMAWIDERD